MIKVRFFALLRERLGTQEISLPSEGILTVNDAISALAEHNTNWSQIFTDQEVIAAVNQQLVDKDQSLQSGDELALFPPVTGG